MTNFEFEIHTVQHTSTLPKRNVRKMLKFKIKVILRNDTDSIFQIYFCFDGTCCFLRRSKSSGVSHYLFFSLYIQKKKKEQKNLLRNYNIFLLPARCSKERSIFHGHLYSLLLLHVVNLLHTRALAILKFWQLLYFGMIVKYTSWNLRPRRKTSVGKITNKVLGYFTRVFFRIRT